jgi:hypothetical protein
MVDASLVDAAQAVSYKPPIHHVNLDQPTLAALKDDILTLVQIRKKVAAEATANRNPGGAEAIRA